MKYKWDKGFLEKQANSELKNMREVFSRLKISTNKTYSILDIGCSDGYNTLLVFHEFANSQILGIDIDKHSVDAVNQKTFPANFRFECFDLQSTNIDEFVKAYGTFDIINCSYVVQYLPYPRNFLEKCFSILNEDGIIIIKSSDDNGKISYPYSELLEEALDIYSKYIAPTADRFCAEKCYTWLQSIGFQNITYNYFVEDTVNKPLDAKLALYQNDFSFRKFDLDGQCKTGLMFQRYDYLLHRLYELFQTNDYYYSSTSYIITAQH